MVLDKSNLSDKDFREFLIKNCSVGYLANYIIKLRNDNSAVKNLTICDVNQQRELLVVFAEWYYVEERWKLNNTSEDDVDDFFNNQ